MKIFKSIMTVGMYTMGSRILGFIRTIIMASFLGSNASADALSIAIRLPSMLRRLFAEGAFNASFIPIYTSMIAIKKDIEAKTFALNILNILVFFLIFLTIVAEIFMPYIVKTMVPGFTGERLLLTVQLTRTTFPFIIFISLCAFYGGILNSLDNFYSFASSPIIGNISIIVIALISLQYVNIAHAFAISILSCGIIQFIWVYIPSRNKGIDFQIKIPTINSKVKNFIYNFIPAATSSGIIQINIFIGSMISSLLPIGNVSILSYADRIIQLPISVIGTAISTALLPILSKHIHQGKTLNVENNQRNALQIALFFTLPITSATIALSEPLVSIIFERGNFNTFQTFETAQILSIFALGLPAYIFIKILSSRFFAQQDTKTPLLAAVLGIILDISICLLLLPSLQNKAIALATTISAWINTIILTILLWYKKFITINKKITLLFIQYISISIITFLLIRISKVVYSYWLIKSNIQCYATIIAIISLGFIIFSLFLYLMRITKTNKIEKTKKI